MISLNNFFIFFLFFLLYCLINLLQNNLRQIRFWELLEEGVKLLHDAVFGGAGLADLGPEVHEFLASDLPALVRIDCFEKFLRLVGRTPLCLRELLDDFISFNYAVPIGIQFGKKLI